MPQGIIVKGIGGFYYVKHNDEIIECKMRGKFRNEKVTPFVGDYVNFEINDDKNGIVTEIFERKNCINRPSVANIDQAIVVISAVHPQPDFLFIDKLITLLEYNNIMPVICINKIDLDETESYKKYLNSYKNIGYTVVTISAKKNIGMEKLRDILQGKVSALAGSSGVGKSTIFKCYFGKFNSKNKRVK